MLCIVFQVPLVLLLLGFDWCWRLFCLIAVLHVIVLFIFFEINIRMSNTKKNMQENSNKVFFSSLLAPGLTRANKATRKKVCQDISRLEKMKMPEKITKEIRWSEAANQKYLANFRLATINDGSLFGQGVEVSWQILLAEKG